MTIENKIKNKDCVNLYVTSFQDKYGVTKQAEDSIFRTMWGFPVKPERIDGQHLNSFKRVYTKELILDIDMDGVNDETPLESIDYKEAEESIYAIINWLQKEFSGLKVNVWFSGRKGFHIGINLDKSYNFKAVGFGSESNRVICYTELVNRLNKLIDSKNVEVDSGLNQVVRIIQLPNVLKQQDDPNKPKDRGYKVCIWNNDKSINDFPNKNDMIKASRNNKNIVEPLVNSKKTCRAFITYLNKLEKNGKKLNVNKKVNINKSVYIDSNNGKAKSLDGFEKMKEIDSVLYPLKQYLYALYPQNGHSKVRCPIISMCGLYLPPSEMEYVFNYLKSDKRGSDKSNPRQGLVNFYNECVKNKFEGGFNTSGIVGSLGALSKEAMKEKKQELKDKASKEDKAKAIEKGNKLEAENKKKWSLFYDLKNWLTEAKKYFEMLQGSFAFQEILISNDKDLPVIFDNYLTDYINNSKVLSQEIIFCLATAIGLVSQFIEVNDKAGSGKTANKIALFSLITNGFNLGIITKSAFLRLTEEDLNNMVVYLHDTGLESPEEKKDTEKIKRLLRELATDPDGLIYRKSDDKDSRKIIALVKEVEALALFITELYTETESFGMGRQLKRVTETVDINGINYEDYITIKKNQFNKEQKEKLKYFKSIFRAYYQHCIHRFEITEPSEEILRGVTDPELESTINDRILAYYFAFCLFFQYEVNDKTSVELFKRFYTYKETNKLESLLKEALYKYVTPVDLNDKKFNPELEGTEETDLEIKLKYALNCFPKSDDISGYVNSRGKPIHFFTVDNAKSYLRILVKGQLKEHRDMTSKLLRELEQQGYIRSTNEIKGRKLYYIPKE